MCAALRVLAEAEPWCFHGEFHVQTSVAGAFASGNHYGNTQPWKGNIWLLEASRQILGLNRQRRCCGGQKHPQMREWPGYHSPSLEGQLLPGRGWLPGSEGASLQKTRVLPGKPGTSPWPIQEETSHTPCSQRHLSVIAVQGVPWASVLWAAVASPVI